MECCQERNSSTVSVWRLQASSRESRPPRTAATTSALRRMTQRVVAGAGKSERDVGEQWRDNPVFRRWKCTPNNNCWLLYTNA